VPVNLLTAPADVLPDTKVLATVIGGVTEYCATGSEAVCPGYDPPPEPEIPPGGGASASAFIEGNGPELAFDGSSDDWSIYSAGALAPQWIRFDFATPTTLAEVRLTVNQVPSGHTVHDLEFLIDGEWRAVTQFSGDTTTGDILVWSDGPVADVSAVRVTTTESPAWPEWTEIEFTTP
ncbi:MAG: discoidin domain-containing protein, partial [Acidimicrobiia bacterium]|nr:discoidin domain-containing protein [Acidimicrobiia bacterium]